MSTFTKLYLTAATPAYTPGTLRGDWDNTGEAVTKALDSSKTLGGGTIEVVAGDKHATDESYNTLMYRGISGPLAAQTISGNLDVVIGVYSAHINYDEHWHIYAYATQGDSDTPRGVLIDDYVEAEGTNEWGTSASTSGKVLNAVQALDLEIEAGDRIVVEIGFIAYNPYANDRFGYLYYGSSEVAAVADDLTENGDGTSLAGYISFSSAITEGDIPDARVTQSPLRVLQDTDQATRVVRVTQSPLRVMQDSDQATRVVRVTQSYLRVLYTAYVAPVGHRMIGRQELIAFGQAMPGHVI